MDHLCLLAKLGIGGVDRRERHDRFDRLATDDPAERARPLPGSAHEPSRDDHLDPLLEPVVTAQNQQDPRAKAQGKYQTPDQDAREPTLHSPNLSQEARIPDRRIRSPCDQTPDDSVVPLQPDDSSGIRALTRLDTRLNQAGQIVATRPIQATPTRWER